MYIRTVIIFLKCNRSGIFPSSFSVLEIDRFLPFFTVLVIPPPKFCCMCHEAMDRETTRLAVWWCGCKEKLYFLRSDIFLSTCTCTPNKWNNNVLPNFQTCRGSLTVCPFWKVKPNNRFVLRFFKLFQTMGNNLHHRIRKLLNCRERSYRSYHRQC